MGAEGYGNHENADRPAKPGSAAPSGADRRAAEDQPKAAGPHAEPHLTNHAATPGSGAMPEGPAPGGEADPGAG